MKTSFVGAKNTYENDEKIILKKHSCFESLKTLRKSRLFRQLKPGFCDKESSHVIAKCRSSIVQRR